MSRVPLVLLTDEIRTKLYKLLKDARSQGHYKGLSDSAAFSEMGANALEQASIKNLEIAFDTSDKESVEETRAEQNQLFKRSRECFALVNELITE